MGEQHTDFGIIPGICKTKNLSIGGMSVMAEFATSIATCVTEIMKMIASVTTSLLANDLFAFGVALLIATMLIGVVASLVRRGRQG